MSETQTVRVNWLGVNYNPCDGFGRMHLSFVRALLMHGIDVMPVDRLVATTWPAWLQRLAGIDMASYLTITSAPAQWMLPLPGRQWLFTMYESTQIPAEWPDLINTHAQRVLVPAPWLVDVFQDCDVKKPVHVVPLGFWPDEFPVIARWPENRPFTFMCIGDRGNRKGWDLAYRAFFAAFPNDSDVRLIIKTRKTGLDFVDMTRGAVGINGANSDRRVSFWREDLPSLAEAFPHCDCFLFPTHGEGWGLPPREAAAMGVPVICTAWSGCAEGIEHWAYPIGCRLVPSQMKAGGYWAEPSLDDLVAQMRWVYEHRDEARAFAREAAVWQREHQTWMHAGAVLADLLEQFA